MTKLQIMSSSICHELQKYGYSYVMGDIYNVLPRDLMNIAVCLAEIGLDLNDKSVLEGLETGVIIRNVENRK